MQVTYWDVFFHCSKQFLNLSVSMPFSASAIFCFTSSTLAKCFPLRTFFILGNKKKLFGVRSDELGGWGTGGHAIFGQKLLNTQHSVGRCTCKSPIMKWTNTLKESSKNSLRPNTASHNTTSWYTDTDEFLEHSPSRSALQKIISFFGGSSITISFHTAQKLF